jgi:hypothetical protein
MVSLKILALRSFQSSQATRIVNVQMALIGMPSAFPTARHQMDTFKGSPAWRVRELTLGPSPYCRPNSLSVLTMCKQVYLWFIRAMTKRTTTLVWWPSSSSQAIRWFIRVVSWLSNYSPVLRSISDIIEIWIAAWRFVGLFCAFACKLAPQHGRCNKLVTFLKLRILFIKQR